MIAAKLETAKGQGGGVTRASDSGLATAKKGP